MNPTKVLLLDVDGVLLLPPETFGERLMRLHPQEEASAFFTGPYRAASTGKADLLDLLPPLMARLGLQGTPERLMAEWFAAENYPNLSLFEHVRQLRRQGWPVYLSTNQEQHRLNNLLNELGLRDLTDGEYASCSVGFRKPDPAYFASVTTALTSRYPGLSATDIVFWDDLQRNVTAARAAGWNAQLYSAMEDFQSRMALLT